MTRQLFPEYHMSPICFSRALFFAAYVVGAAACAQRASSSATDQRLLILFKNDQQMSIVDPATLKILGKVPTGPDPHEVVASDDGTRAYISNYGGGLTTPSPSSISSIRNHWAPLILVRSVDAMGCTLPEGRSGSPRKPRKQSAATIRRRTRSI
jgi:hypothetical protein